LIDRIDLQIEVPAVAEQDLVRTTGGESSAVVRARVAAAASRQRGRQGKANAKLSTREIDQICAPDAAGAALLKQAISRLGLTARAYHRVLKIARTIADLAEQNLITSAHVAEAIQFRRFDRG
jgi:magnesium chelatase family protein